MNDISPFPQIFKLAMFTFVFPPRIPFQRFVSNVEIIDFGSSVEYLLYVFFHLVYYILVLHVMSKDRNE